MKYFFKLPVMLMVLLTLMGCAYINGRHSYYYRRSTRYLTAQEEPPLAMPAGLSHAKISTFYSIPSIEGTAGPRPVSLAPPGSLAAKTAYKGYLFGLWGNYEPKRNNSATTRHEKTPL